MVIPWCSVLSVLLGNTFPALFPHRTLLLNQHSSVIGASVMYQHNLTTPALPNCCLYQHLSLYWCSWSLSASARTYWHEGSNEKSAENPLQQHNGSLPMPHHWSWQSILLLLAPTLQPQIPTTKKEVMQVLLLSPSQPQQTLPPLKCNTLTRISTLHPLPPQWKKSCLQLGPHSNTLG